MTIDPDELMQTLLSMGLVRYYISCAVRYEDTQIADHTNDWQTVGSVGGGRVWALTTQFADGHATSWVPVLRYVGGDAPWEVEYQGFNDVFPDDSQPVEVAAELLKAALIDIRDFACDMDLHWSKTFEGALARLAGGAGTSYLADMCPDGSFDA